MDRSLVGIALVALLGCPVSLASEYRKINGTVTVAAGQSVDKASTVNGSVRIGEKARVGTARTVNGSITLANGASAGNLETVNGRVEVGPGAQIQGDLEAVNGRLQVRDGSVIGGGIKNVNGRIEIGKAQVKGRITTVSGDLTIGAGGRVDGGILYRKPSLSWNADGDRPRIVIGPGAVVGGTLAFEREVELHVSDKATIGPVPGAKPVLFTGSEPGN